MAIEIERRFLVDPMGDWRHASRRETCRQGYIQTSAPCSMRVRLLGNQIHYLKTKRGIHERNSNTPFLSRRQNTCWIISVRKPRSARPTICSEATTWEVDVFEGANQGLISSSGTEEPNQKIHLPEWGSKKFPEIVAISTRASHCIPTGNGPLPIPP